MPLIQFPNVPPLPGVPPLARAAITYPLVATGGLALANGSLSGIGAAQVLASQLGLGNALSFGTSLFGSLALDALTAGPLPKYAILGSNNARLLDPDSVVEFDVHADSGIMTHPIEQGFFEAYNRVQEPIAIRLMLACTNVKMTRQGFLSALEALREGTTLATIATPERAYRNMALRGFGYRKTAERGAVTIWADTTWLEARSTGVTVSAPPTSQPYGAAASNLGALQPQALTTTQFAAVGNPATVPAPLPARLVQEMPPSGAAQ